MHCPGGGRGGGGGEGTFAILVVCRGCTGKNQIME